MPNRSTAKRPAGLTAFFSLHRDYVGSLGSWQLMGGEATVVAAAALVVTLAMVAAALSDVSAELPCQWE